MIYVVNGIIKRWIGFGGNGGYQRIAIIKRLVCADTALEASFAVTDEIMKHYDYSSYAEWIYGPDITELPEDQRLLICGYPMLPGLQSCINDAHLRALATQPL